MPAVSLREILQPAFAARYGVGAFNIVNDLTMAAVLDAAVEVKSPVIIQFSVKTVKMWGARLLQQMFAEMASHRSIPATLHLDHCPDIEMIKTCFEAGWNSALYDASRLSYQDNLRLCKEVVALAKKHGAGVEGELEAVRGIEDDVGSEAEGELVPVERASNSLKQRELTALRRRSVLRTACIRPNQKSILPGSKKSWPEAPLRSFSTAERDSQMRLLRN
jgi:fructose-bisphosphate aldolase, class II